MLMDKDGLFSMAIPILLIVTGTCNWITIIETIAREVGREGEFRMEIVVYKLMVAGDVKCVAKTEKEIQFWVDSGGLEAIFGLVDYMIISEKMILPGVTGRFLVDKDDESIVHVEWQCPYCGQFNFTDLSEEEVSPALWFCENCSGGHLCLINFGANPLCGE